MPTFQMTNRHGSRSWKIYLRTFSPNAPAHTVLEIATATADSVVVTASGDLVGHSGVGNGTNILVFCYAKGTWESCHLV